MDATPPTRHRGDMMCLLFPLFMVMPPQGAGTPPDALGGRFRSLVIHSEILDEDRTVFIRLPESFDRTGPDRRYPVVVVLDGRSLGGPVAAAVDSLVSGAQMPEVIVAAVASTDRLRDLTPPGLSVSGSSLTEGGDRFLDFIEGELLVQLERDFRAGRPRVLAGHSSGGILTSWAAATRPGFILALALDTPAHLGDGWLADRLAERPDRTTAPLRFAALDARFGWPDEAWARVREAAPASWALFRDRLADETHQSMPLLGAYLGLRWLFRDYSIVGAPAAPPRAVRDHYVALGATYGAPVPPPFTLSSQLVDDLLMARDGRAARQAYDALVRDYGAPANAAALEARIAEVERLPPPAETVEGLLAMPMASGAAISPFVGEWAGETWSRPEQRSPATLRLRVIDGVVSGELVSWPAGAGGPEVAQPLQHLRVTSDGLAFGYLNGMRPRGVLLYEVARRGDVLEGTMRLAGLEFTLPNGQPLPVTHIRLSRVRRESR